MWKSIKTVLFLLETQAASEAEVPGKKQSERRVIIQRTVVQTHHFFFKTNLISYMILCHLLSFIIVCMCPMSNAVKLSFVYPAEKHDRV